MSQRRYFGTDGIRGKVGQFPITPDFVLKLGWLLAEYSQSKVLKRLSSVKILVSLATCWSLPWKQVFLRQV